MAISGGVLPSVICSIATSVSVSVSVSVILVIAVLFVVVFSNCSIVTSVSVSASVGILRTRRTTAITQPIPRIKIKIMGTITEIMKFMIDEESRSKSVGNVKY